jgi:hypothetical protein
MDGFEARWTDDAGKRLRDAFDDFVTNPEARVALALRLGDSPELSDVAMANQERWERGVQSRVRVLLREQLFAQALTELRQRDTRSMASKLFFWRWRL